MHKYIRLAALIFIDAVLVTLSVFIAYLLRFDFSIKDQYRDTLPYVFTLFGLLSIGSFYLFKIYRRIWQYASLDDLLAIIKGSSLSVVAAFLIHREVIYPYYSETIVPRSIYPLTLIISFLAVGGSRLIWRLLRDSYGKITPHHRKVLIIGAGEAGVMVVKEIRRAGSIQYPVAYVDDNKHKQHYEVMGIPVAGTREDIPSVVRKYKIDDIIVAIPTASHTEISDIIKRCKLTGCQIKIVPRMNDLINGNITVNMIRDVSVEDLLGREPVKVDMDEITNYVKDQVVLITGAGGSIGSEICRQVAAVQPKQLLILGHGENSIYEIEMELRKTYPSLKLEPIIADVQASERIQQVFRQYRPQVVFHAAAHKHVPLMEANPQEAIKNNVFGTRNVAECAHAFGAKRFVLISTDKAVNPTSVMGATKRIAEMILQNINAKSNTIYTAVRFGNVLGSRGSVIPVFKKQIAEGGPVTVTHPEMIRYFMTIPEAVQLVIQAGSLATGGEVFILDMGQPVKIAELASDLIRLSGLEPGKDIQIAYTGLRPGEKLFEEILTSEEGASATKHDRIFVSKQPVVANDILQVKLKEFEKQTLQEAGNPVVIKRLLKQLVPSYKLQEDEPSDQAEDVSEQIRATLEMVASLENK